MDMTDLKPYVLLGQRCRRRVDNVLEALQKSGSAFSGRCGQRSVTYLEGLVVLLLLLVDYTQPEVYLMGLVEIRLHFHNLRKRIFGVVQGAVSVIQDANAVPEAGFLLFARVSKLVMGRRKGWTNLRVRKMDQGRLVCIVRLLQIIHHQIAVS